ncbi:porin, partial [Paraburkholderia sp. MPAMCS5]|nr:porin [Paraburkholderia sp. MPAMCS5]
MARDAASIKRFSTQQLEETDLKKRYLGVAVAAGVFGASGAYAQSSVQLYGLMDLSVPTYRTHADANGNHVIGMGN